MAQRLERRTGDSDRGVLGSNHADDTSLRNFVINFSEETLRTALALEWAASAWGLPTGLRT